MPDDVHVPPPPVSTPSARRRSLRTRLLVRLLVAGLFGTLVLAAGTGTAAAVTNGPHPVLPAGPRLIGPGDTGPQVRDVQARLRQRGLYRGDVTGRYAAPTVRALRKFQRARHLQATGNVDATTRQRLNRSTHRPTAAELSNQTPPAQGLDRRCRTGRVMCIDKRSRLLRWVVGGQVRRTMAVRFGGRSTPTREGLFHVQWKDRNHVSSIYGSAMPFAMFFSGGQAVHYSSDFARHGYAGASHGCVNVRDYGGLRWLFDQVHVGDRVVVYWS